MIVVRTVSNPPKPYDGVFMIEENTWAMYRNILRNQTCEGYAMSDFFNASQIVDEHPTDAITSFVIKLGYNNPLDLLEKCYQQYLEYIEFVDKNMSVIFPGMFTENQLEPELQKEKEYARMLATETDAQCAIRRKQEVAAIMAKVRKAEIADKKREANLATKQSEWITVGKK